ncbi:hypothetical protein GTQ48_17260 [Alteromonas genovensis]|uniref:Uncharacterized protein n=1 Tax=Alteromonas genovensis TaxID=471225 RepID=A0A6N9TIX0_9ALTE|nr:hypothetical protein [Alteromonas genovensis]NDW17267.1 hypothetical protein [Alteromonas genovensis]
MNLEVFFEIVDSSIKRMAAPIAVLAAGFILAKEAQEGSDYLALSATQWLYIGITLSLAYTFAVVINGFAKINETQSKESTLLVAKFSFASIFFLTTLGAVSLAISKAT